MRVASARWRQHRTLVVSVAAALIVGMSALGALAVQQQRNNWALQDKNDKLRDKNDELRVKNDELIATQLDLAVVANKGGMLLMDSIQDSASTQFLHRIRMLMQFVVVRAFFEHSLATAAKLTEKYPGDPKYRFNYAMTQRNLGIPLQWLQLESEAVALLEYSRDAFVKLANEHSESPVFAYESERSLYALANGYTTLGATRFDAYQPRDVTEWFAKAQPILDDLLLRNAENKQWKELNERNLFIWCLVLRQLAVEQFGTKDYAKGLALFERALPIARKQHATNTKNKDWPVLRRNLLLGTGLMCKDRLGQLDRAKPTERKEMIRIANLGIEVFNEANPVDFAPQVRELANIREELSK